MPIKLFIYFLSSCNVGSQMKLLTVITIALNYSENCFSHKTELFVQRILDSQWFNLKFFYITMLQNQYAFNRKCSLNFELCLFLGSDGGSMLSGDASSGQPTLQLPVRYVITRANN